MSGSRAHDGEIFHQAETHNPSLSFEMNWKLGPSFQMRCAMCESERRKGRHRLPTEC